MKRNIITDAIVLKTSSFGEIHKNVTLFSRDNGILNATAYGAHKSTGKLRSTMVPFASGTVYLYNEPVKGSWKIQEMDVRDFHLPLREDLKKFYAASLWSEIILFSHGGGGGDDTSDLFVFFTDALRDLASGTDELEVTFSTIQFIWHFLQMAGIRPDTESCARCENPVPASKGLSYSKREGGFVCEDCRDVIDPRINPGTRRYLEYTSEKPYREAVKIRLAKDAAFELKSLMYALAESALDRQLLTLKAGEGIL